LNLQCTLGEHTLYFMSEVAAEPKTDRLVARVSRRQKDILARAAALEERTLAGFVIAHAMDRAESVLNQKNVIRLNQEQSIRFFEVISRKPRPLSAATIKAQKAYKAKVVEV
jgi:uncharacterized protein (DUF1778 family)